MMNWRIAGLIVVTGLLIWWLSAHAAIPQPLEYHNFADQRTLLGIPHFWNVISNVPFAIIGGIGCWWLLRRGSDSEKFLDPRDRVAYLVFFGGEVLTAFGSAYYHASPSNETLVWDRLVFSLLLTSIFAIVLTEFVAARLGHVTLAPLVVIGLLSVLQWRWSEVQGHGDLRLYLFVQFYPVLVIPMILLAFRSSYSHAKWFWLVLWMFVAAKIAEFYDRPIYQATTGFWSGHTVKHFVAAGATYFLLDMVRRRHIARL